VSTCRRIGPAEIETLIAMAAASCMCDCGGRAFRLKATPDKYVCRCGLEYDLNTNPMVAPGGKPP